MGQIRLISDESWWAARLVTKRFESRFDDAELVEAVHVVREIVAEALRRFHERIRREEHRLYGIVPARTQDPPGMGPSKEG